MEVPKDEVAGQVGYKSGPRWAEEGPKRAQDGPRRAPEHRTPWFCQRLVGGLGPFGEIFGYLRTFGAGLGGSLGGFLAWILGLGGAKMTLACVIDGRWQYVQKTCM